MKHGMVDPNGGFVVFRKKGVIIGQAWVWYNEEKKKLCLDNIEIPNSRKKGVKRNIGEFIEAIERLKNGIKAGMGDKVELITMGNGYNDLLGYLTSSKIQNVLAGAAVSTEGMVKNLSKGKLKEQEVGGAPIDVNYTDTKYGERVIYRQEQEEGMVKNLSERKLKEKKLVELQVVSTQIQTRERD